MTVTETDIREVQALINPILSRKAWGASLGVGSFITLEFGDSLPPNQKRQRTHGEWHLWIYCCAWRIEKGNEVLASSEDPREKLELAVQQLEGLALNSIQLLPPAWDTVFSFDEEVFLRSFSIYSEESEHWMLYTPDGNVLSVGPGSSWSYESSSTVPS
ncbi:MAG TPA: hypothetical protein DDZ80_09060 [Cyanobacteria bacterium UBA8803]|nr:hypothetical protein [Cyanobacteria bacterium UBA8803]